MKGAFLVLTIIFTFLTANAQATKESVWYIVDDEKKIEGVTSHEGVYNMFAYLASSKMFLRTNGDFSLYNADAYFTGTYSYDYRKMEGRLILKDKICPFNIVSIGNYQKMIVKNWNKNESLIFVGKDNIMSENTTNDKQLTANTTPISVEDEQMKRSNEQAKEGDKYMECRKYDLASKAYRMAYKENSNNCYALYKEGLAYIFWGGNYDNVVLNLLKVLECNSTASEEYKVDAGECYYYIGYSYSKKGDKIRSNEFMQKAADAGNKKAQEWLKK